VSYGKKRLQALVVLNFRILRSNYECFLLTKEVEGKMKKRKLRCLGLLLLAFFALSIFIPSFSLATAPIGEWKFDEGYGIETYDSSGQGKTGRLWGPVDWVEGINNKALQFTDTGQVQVPGSITGDINTLCNWSISIYIKPTGTGEGYVYSERDDANNLCLYVSVTADNRIKVATNHSLRPGWDTYQTDPNKIKRNEWSHLVVTLGNGGLLAKSGTVKCYVNGVLAGQGPLGSSAVSLSYTGNAIPYTITKPDQDHYALWLKINLQGNETKYFCIRKVPGYTPENPTLDTIFEFYDDFEIGTVNASKWELITPEDLSAGIFSDWKYDLYSIGISKSRNTTNQNGFILAKIPLNKIPVGNSLKWASENYVSWSGDRNMSFSISSALVTEQLGLDIFTASNPNPSGSVECNYDLIIKRVSTNDWVFDVYKNGEYLSSKSLTQSFENYLLLGLSVSAKGNGLGGVSSRMDNVIVRKYAPIEPTVTVHDFADYYIVSVKNNLETALTDYQLSIPGEELNLLDPNTSLEIKQVTKSS
jgi:hypothetical protein